MAMAMEENASWPGLHGDIQGRSKFIEKDAIGSYRFSLLLCGSTQQGGSVFFDCRETAWFAEENFLSSRGDRVQAFDHFFRMVPGFFQKTLGDERASTAAWTHYVHATAAFFQDFQGCYADLRVVVIGEGVVEEREWPAVRRPTPRFRGSADQPTLEGLTSVRGEGSAMVYVQELFV